MLTPTPKYTTCLYLATTMPSQLGTMRVFAHKVRLLPSDQKKGFRPSKLLAEFKKELKNNIQTRTHQYIDKLNKFITEKKTPTKTWNTSRLVLARLIEAKKRRA